jgi:hypothetical protein
MTWTKTSDDHPDRRLGLSDAAYRLEHAALTYSNRLLLDGRIPKAQLRMLPVPERCLAHAVLAELLEDGRLVDRGDAYEIADYFTAQPSADEVVARRRYDALRQALVRTPADSPERPGLEAAVIEARTAQAEAIERRRALSRRDIRSDVGPDIRSESLARGPDPTRPVPSRPVPVRQDPSPSRAPARGTTGTEIVASIIPRVVPNATTSGSTNGSTGPAVRPNGDETVDCRNYMAHRSSHHRDGGRFVCDLCSSVPTS